jgi:hypothetical protein
LFHPAPAPTDEDVARVVAAVFRRVERALADREPDAAQRRFIESAPVLAAVAEASAWASAPPALAVAAEASAFVAGPPISMRS